MQEKTDWINKKTNLNKRKNKASWNKRMEDLDYILKQTDKRNIHGIKNRMKKTVAIIKEKFEIYKKDIQQQKNINLLFDKIDIANVDL